MFRNVLSGFETDDALVFIYYLWFQDLLGFSWFFGSLFVSIAFISRSLCGSICLFVVFLCLSLWFSYLFRLNLLVFAVCFRFYAFFLVCISVAVSLVYLRFLSVCSCGLIVCFVLIFVFSWFGLGLIIFSPLVTFYSLLIITFCLFVLVV